MALVDDLAALQDLDDALAKDAARLREMRAQMRESEEVAALRAAAQESEKALAETRRALHDLEVEAQSVSEKRKAGRDRLYSGKVANPRELQNLEAESEALGRRLAQLEDQVLECMMAAEQATSHRDQLVARLQEQVAAEGNRMRDLSAQAEALRQQVLQRQELAQRLRAGLPTATLAQYDGIKARKAGRAVARLRHGVCSACGVQVPTHVVQRAQQREGLVSCPSCARLLCPE